MQGHARAFMVKPIGRHLSDLQPPEKHGVADVERAHVRALEHELAPRHTGREYGRHLEPDEIAAGLALGADVHADERARQQRAQARDAPAGNARSHDPEAGIVDERVRGVAIQFGGSYDPFPIRRQSNPFDHADVHVLEFYFGLARLQAFTGLEADGDSRTFFQDRLYREPAADQHRDKRHQPDELNAPARAGSGNRFGEIWRPIHDLAPLRPR